MSTTSNALKSVRQERLLVHQIMIKFDFELIYLRVNAKRIRVIYRLINWRYSGLICERGYLQFFRSNILALDDIVYLPYIEHNIRTMIKHENLNLVYLSLVTCLSTYSTYLRTLHISECWKFHSHPLA